MQPLHGDQSAIMLLTEKTGREAGLHADNAIRIHQEGQTMLRKNDAPARLAKGCLAIGLACMLAAPPESAHPASHAALKLAAGSAASTAAAAGDIAVIKSSADAAQSRCYPFMHDDATQYASCLNALLAGVKGKDPIAQQQRLGIAYFAWVGANSSARMSLPGAEAAARAFLPRFRKIQRQLHLADAALCLSIAGDCTARLAQMTQMEKELAQAKPVARPAGSGQK